MRGLLFVLFAFFILSCEGKNNNPDIYVALVSDFSSIEKMV